MIISIRPRFAGVPFTVQARPNILDGDSSIKFIFKISGKLETRLDDILNTATFLSTQNMSDETPSIRENVVLLKTCALA
jgi:hypothetical protein